ncbi:hypothetical protein FVEG_06605 [Fusarium verticillioides 7600]|uniref:Uncharacterized protein n=1 Tax=Gibberella moniliformis (strain M3125 / FGSC 7600) TaxID=334819 RepID=W7M348_GIBM7|nr:hypothetical protein FVEG_06605 [Fusarium verticillioides 7600]EWG45978.1 hypothetical protein FVEG_06605 [Fusarium verticillioides 7600]
MLRSGLDPGEGRVLLPYTRPGRKPLPSPPCLGSGDKELRMASATNSATCFFILRSEPSAQSCSGLSVSGYPAKWCYG